MARLSERVEGVRTDRRELRSDMEKTADKLQVVEQRYERIINRALGAAGLITIMWAFVEKFIP